MLVELKILEKALSLLERGRKKELERKVAEVNFWEEKIAPLSDEKLKAKTEIFKRRLAKGETLDDLLPEAFAVVREVAKRTLNMRHFDVQIMGGIVLHQGKIAEMKTGEGKTLVATLPAYLNALTGKSVHIVTVNDYLAKRDSEWMGPIYEFLGLKVGLLQNLMEPQFRKIAYQCDVVYGTNSEFGFDYLRDNMATNLEEIVQRGHYYAIIDEVDSILIDEARTPLIISGPSERSAQLYRTFARLVPRLKEKIDYEVDYKTRTVVMTERGIKRVEEMIDVDNLFNPSNIHLINHLNQALKAHTLFKKDVDYIVKDGEVIIVDEFTGRLMYGRRYSEGLHQAIEAKEQVHIREENQTLATITLQNYFRMYEKLAGMTGTAATEADEFMHIYGLEVVVIPTNKPMIRKDLPDVIYKSEEGKFKAVVNDIIERYQRGQPVLVGTISIEKSEKLSEMLKKRGIPHQVLNAKHHEKEAQIIAQAGKEKTVTVATNMAGRGVDIILGGNPPSLTESKKIVELGGLHVLGTERHEARRIDNQLRGRSGRQGDPGSSQFYISLEDELMKAFGMDKVKNIMERLGLPDDQPIEHPLISKTIETAQKQIESQNFMIRKHLLEYDDVLNTQREVIYQERRRILTGDDLHEKVESILKDVVVGAVEAHTNKHIYPEEWDLDGLFSYFSTLIPLPFGKKDLDLKSLTQEELIEKILESTIEFYKKREEKLGSEVMRELERMIMLQVIDYHWREHLYDMDYLREGIGLRAIGQRDPLIEYKRESYDLFQNMLEMIKEDFVRYIFHVEVVEEPRRQRVLNATGSGNSLRNAQVSRKKVGRNDPCPCGSGKKYKKCCGR